MPAPAATGAVVGVVGRLAGKKGAQAAAGAAAKEGAEEAVEGGAKAVAGKVQQGLGMVQANQQQAQQKRQNMQQRLQDATREGASTGSTIGKAILVKRNSSMEDAFDLGYPLIDYDDLHDKQRAIVDLISNKDNTRVPSYWDDPASGEFETEYYNMMFHPEKHHLYPDEAFDQYYRYLQHYYEASDKTRQLPHSKQMEIMDALPIHPEHPAEIAELKMAGEFSHDPVWTSANPHKAFFNKYHGLRKAVLVKERKSPEAMRHKREYDKKYESSPERVKYREDLNRERRRRGIYGSGDHMDVSHTEGGGLTLESQHANRGRHFKERGTLRPIAKSLREDLELLRNLLAGPMDEQDKKIGLAMVGMLEERHENDDDDDEEEKPKPKQTGFLSTLLR